MAEKRKVTMSDHLFEDTLGYRSDLKVHVMVEPRRILESEPKFGDGPSWEAGNHRQDPKWEEIVVLEDATCDTSAVAEDLAAPRDMELEYLTESRCVDTENRDKHGKRVNTNDHPLNKKVKCETIEDRIEEETAVSTASIVKQDNVSPAGMSEPEGDARSTAVTLPTAPDELKPYQEGKMCVVCGLIFPSKAQRKEHQATHPVGVKVHHCVVCSKWFQYLHEIVNHKRHPKHISNREKPHKCTICCSRFPEADELTAHQHLRHSQKCPVCGLVFATKREKKKHQTTHASGEKTHQCAGCSKWFEFLREIETHTCIFKQLNTQEKQQNLHLCTFCGIQFSEIEDLTVHLSVHPKLKCSICGLRFVTKSEKKEHKTTHIAGEKTHHCTLCNKWFEYLIDFENHTLLKHPNSLGGTHNCTRCYSSFTMIEDLNAHMLSHEKKCQVCGLTFATKGERNKHQADHPAGGKSHHCIECDKWFVTPNQIELHALQKHMDCLTKPYKCNVCGKAFLYADALSDHKEKH